MRIGARGSGGTALRASGNVRVMSVHGSFHLTAIDPEVDVGIVRSHLVIRYWDRWRFRRVQYSGDALISSGKVYGMWSYRHGIPRGRTREVHGDWIIEPAFRAEHDTRPIRGRAYFVDQLGNAHTTREKVVFAFQP
jgi:hypothetical protein